MNRLLTLRARVGSIDCGARWVCQCCMLSHANGECCADDEHGGDGIAPWSDVDDRYSVTMGLLPVEHHYSCAVYEAGKFPSDYDGCDCERDSFSSWPCEGCGSSLAGERWAFTLWREPRRFVSGISQVA